MVILARSQEQNLTRGQPQNLHPTRMQAPSISYSNLIWWKKAVMHPSVINAYCACHYSARENHRTCSRTCSNLEFYDLYLTFLRLDELFEDWAFMTQFASKNNWLPASCKHSLIGNLMTLESLPIFDKPTLPMANALTAKGKCLH